MQQQSLRGIWLIHVDKDEEKCKKVLIRHRFPTVERRFRMLIRKNFNNTMLYDECKIPSDDTLCSELEKSLFKPLSLPYLKIHLEKNNFIWPVVCSEIFEIADKDEEPKKVIAIAIPLVTDLHYKKFNSPSQDHLSERAYFTSITFALRILEEMMTIRYPHMEQWIMQAFPFGTPRTTDQELLNIQSSKKNGDKSNQDTIASRPSWVSPSKPTNRSGSIKLHWTERIHAHLAPNEPYKGIHCIDWEIFGTINCTSDGITEEVTLILTGLQELLSHRRASGVVQVDFMFHYCVRQDSESFDGSIVFIPLSHTFRLCTYRIFRLSASPSIDDGRRAEMIESPRTPIGSPRINRSIEVSSTAISLQSKVNVIFPVGAHFTSSRSPQGSLKLKLDLFAQNSVDLGNFSILIEISLIDNVQIRKIEAIQASFGKWSILDNGVITWKVQYRNLFANASGHTLEMLLQTEIPKSCNPWQSPLAFQEHTGASIDDMPSIHPDAVAKAVFHFEVPGRLFSKFGVCESRSTIVKKKDGTATRNLLPMKISTFGSDCGYYVYSYCNN